MFSRCLDVDGWEYIFLRAIPSRDQIAYSFCIHLYINILLCLVLFGYRPFSPGGHNPLAMKLWRRVLPCWMSLVKIRVHLILYLTRTRFPHRASFSQRQLKTSSLWRSGMGDSRSNYTSNCTNVLSTAWSLFSTSYVPLCRCPRDDRQLVSRKYYHEHDYFKNVGNNNSIEEVYCKCCYYTFMGLKDSGWHGSHRYSSHSWQASLRMISFVQILK